MRVVTAFKRMLHLDGWASVIDVSFEEEGRDRAARAAQAPPPRVLGVRGEHGRHLKIVDCRTRRWRHLELGVNRCTLECRLRRLRCLDCGVRYEAVHRGPAQPAVHARGRGRGGVLGAADGQDADSQADADRVGPGRRHRHSRRRRAPQRGSLLRPGADRRGDGVFILHLRQQIVGSFLDSGGVRNSFAAGALDLVVEA